MFQNDPFLTFDPFEGREPWNQPDQDANEEYRCAGCYDCHTLMGGAGEICTECLLHMAEYA